MKFNLFILLCLAFMFSSCLSIIVKESPIMYSTQAFRGKIESVDMVNYSYPMDNTQKDTIVSKGKMVFDENYRITMETETYGKIRMETIYLYHKNQLSSSTSKRGKNEEKKEYVYDKKGRIIEEYFYNGDKLSYSKKSKYDSFGNPVNIIYSGDFSNRHETRKYNYKEKIVLLKEINKATNEILFVKLNFDNNGNIVKRSDIRAKEDAQFGPSVEFEYDKNGNLLEKKLVGPTGKAFAVTIYQSTFDEKGNILSREIYWNDKLIEKTSYNITYRN